MKLRVPLVDLSVQYESIRDEVDAAILDVVRRQQFVLGPDVERFETEFAELCDARYAVGCGSGTDALLLALMALDIGPGDQVICPAYSFVATATCIARLGAEPIFVDVDPATCDLDVAAARKAAATCTRLRAIIVVDLFGRCADLDGTLALGREFDVAVVEDAAQAVGADDVTGARAGSRASIGCFSLYPTKNLGAYGDAGILTTNDPEISERLRSLRVHGSGLPYRHHDLGINSRLDTIQAAVLRVKLQYLDGWTKLRCGYAAHYDRAFLAAGAVRAGSGFGPKLPVKIPPATQAPARCVYHQYVVRVPAPDRDALREHLAERGIDSAIYYPLGLHQQECFAGASDAEPEVLPETESAARESLALPVHSELRPEQLEHVISSLLDFFRREGNPE